MSYVRHMLNLQVDGHKVRTHRESRGMTVAVLAEKAGCTRWNIYRIEQGGQPSAETYARIRKALRATDADLLHAEGSAA